MIILYNYMCNFMLRRPWERLERVGETQLIIRLNIIIEQVHTAFKPKQMKNTV